MKYKITIITKNFDGSTIYRVRAIKDFDDVKAGQLGGWVESETNLSQKGNCWLYDNAVSYGDCKVRGDFKVRGLWNSKGNLFFDHQGKDRTYTEILADLYENER